MNKSFIQKKPYFIVPKRELTSVLTYLGENLLNLKTRLRRAIEKYLPYCKLKAITDLRVDLTPYFGLKIHLSKKCDLE